MEKLPHWKLTDKHPAFYDTESMSAIEQTAKVYGAMQSLIDETNTFIDTLNKAFEDFTTSTADDNENFAVGLRQEFQDFINVVELKIDDLANQIASDTFVETVNREIATFEATTNASIEELKNDTNETINAFKNSTNTEIEAFKTDTNASLDGIRTDFADLENAVDERMENVEVTMIDKIEETTSAKITEAINDGTITLKGEYDETTESYNLVVSGQEA